MIAKFDKTSLKNVRAELNAVLAKYGMNQGLELNIGSIRFTENEFSAKLDVKIAGKATRKDTMLQSIMKSHNLSEDGLGNRKLESYNPRSYKYPFCFDQNGSKFKCSLEQAKKYFSKV